ncbi:MAG: UnbV [Planctomycetaceae bacterium]|nr:UnbV [Planctomycetaceae bacterium]
MGLHRGQDRPQMRFCLASRHPLNHAVSRTPRTLWTVNWRAGLASVAAAIMLSGCFGPNGPADKMEPAPPSAAPRTSEGFQFVDDTATAGIQFTYRSGAQPEYAPILQDMGGGCGLLDLDRDGILDAFFPGGGFISESQPQPFPNGIFRGLGNGTFRDVSQPSGVQTGRFYSLGVACADYDSDGFPDILVTGYGGLELLRNQGDGTFGEQTSTAGLTDRMWSTSAAWGDVNGDGNLDLYLCHYVDWSPKNDPVCTGPTPKQPESCPPAYFKGLPDTLYLNTGSGVFEDISRQAGLRLDGKGLGVAMADLDADGDVDIYVANDTVANFLYRNEGCSRGGIPRLTEIGPESGTALSESGTADGSMGVTILDLNQDSRPDIWVSNFEFETPGLYRNDGEMRFTHMTRVAGLANQSSSFVSFGTVAADFDGDGDSDVLVTNGHISRYPQNGDTLQPCQLFENLGGTRFRDVAASTGTALNQPRLGRGLAVGDLDGDGDPDAILSPKDAAITVFKNTQTVMSHWLGIQLAGTASPRDGNGAKVTLLRNGTRTTLWCYSGESYLSSSSSRLLFADQRPLEALELKVTWPSGSIQRLRRPAARAPQEAVWSVDSGRCYQVGIALNIIEPGREKTKN